MARKKKEKVPNPLTAQRKAEIAKETEAALASARKSESDRVARVGAAGVKGTERKAVDVDANPGVKFKKVDQVDARVSGEEDQGPSAAPKPQSSTARAKRTMVSPQKKLREKGLRTAKNRELNKGVMAVTVANETPAPRPARKGAKKTKTGKKHSEQHKKAVSDGLKGHVISEETKRKNSERFKGQGNPMYGKAHPKHLIEQIRLKNIGKINFL
jgi:hypothetical protein